MSEIRVGCGGLRRMRAGRLQSVLHLVSRVGLVLVVALALTGCGRKGNPQPPPGQQNAFPRTYPST